jgi:hypothetical protein
VKQILGNLFNLCFPFFVFLGVLFVGVLSVLYLFCASFVIGHCAVKLEH